MKEEDERYHLEEEDGQFGSSIFDRMREHVDGQKRKIVDVCKGVILLHKTASTNLFLFEKWKATETNVSKKKVDRLRMISYQANFLD
jgi:hypothetical protein